MSSTLANTHLAPSGAGVDTSKRTWLIASSCAGAVGAGFVAVPFVSSFSPSERAKAAGAAVEVDISALKAGEKMTVEWRGKPVWIVKRTPAQLAALKVLDPQLADPSRSILLQWVSVPIWVVRRPINSRQVRKPLCLTTGRVAFCALAMVLRSIWLVAFTKTSLHQTIWKFHPTCICRTPDWSLAKTRKLKGRRTWRHSKKSPPTPLSAKKP
jgi:Ubiquitinol-cytochrome C reductase Fe-S subunit TAT signal